MQIWQAACTCWEGIAISNLHLDALNSLVDVFQQGFVLWNLILLLVGVDVRQSRHIVLKVLLTDRFLQGKRPKMKKDQDVLRPFSLQKNECRYDDDKFQLKNQPANV